MVLPLLAVVAMVAAGCSEDRSTASADSSAPAPEACSPEDLLACARLSSIADLVPDEPTPADGETFTIGMVNQENSPAGSFPELSAAAQGFAEWMNDELGGVGGRPIEVVVCNTGFSAEGSTACGQQFVDDGVEVVLGGIDVFGNSIDALTANGIPWIGGIPVSFQSMTSDLSFQFSGGTWGAAVAFAEHAYNDQGARAVSIVYGDFGSIAEGARVARDRLEELGATVQMVPFPVVSTDLGPPLQAAAASDPDAVFVLAADSGCESGFDAAAAIGLEADLYFTGACASPKITDAIGEPAEGAFFNVENVVSESDPDGDLYTAVLARTVPDLDPLGAATVSARSLVNLWVVLQELGPDRLDSESIAEAMRSQVDTPSFMGHPYTCDGRQFPGLPATCSPQQIMVQLQDGELVQVGDWIEVGA